MYISEQEFKETMRQLDVSLEFIRSYQISEKKLKERVAELESHLAAIDSSEAKLSAVPANNPWQQAIDDELVNTHLGIAQDGVTREEAKEKLNNLIAWHIDVAKYFDAQAQQPKQEPEKCINSDSWNCKYCRKTATCKAIDDPRNYDGTIKPQPAHEPVSSNEHVKQESWISVEDAKAALKEGDLLYVTFQNGDVAKAVYRWEQGYYPHRIECEKYGNERLEICTHIMHRKPVPLPQQPVKSQQPAGFISAKTVEWLNSIGEMIDAKMELTFRTEPSVEPYTIPFYLAPHEPVSSNEHVKQESKLQRRIDRLVKRLEDYKLKYEGKEKQLTFHAGYDMGYVEGQLSILEELPLPPVVRKNDEPVKEVTE